MWFTHWINFLTIYLEIRRHNYLTCHVDNFERPLIPINIQLSGANQILMFADFSPLLQNKGNRHKICRRVKVTTTVDNSPPSAGFKLLNF